MGCCQSTTHDEAPAEGGVVAPPRTRPVLQAAASVSSIESNRLSLDASTQRLTGHDRPNRPIRLPSPVRSSPTHVSHLSPPWTRAQLESERAAFFDTRVSGRAEIWSAIRLVCESLQAGHLEQAQAILDAVNVTCPHGRVASGRGRDRTRGGLYDEYGQLYDVPAWIVSDPRDVVDTGEKTVMAGAESDDARKEEKGKGPATDPGEMIQIRARMSDHTPDVTVSVGKKEKVAAIVRRLQEQTGPKRLRLIYLGQVLHENKTLEANGYKPGDLVNAFVFDAPEEWLRKQ